MIKKDDDVHTINNNNDPKKNDDNNTIKNNESTLTRLEVIHMMDIEVPSAHVRNIHVEAVQRRRQRLPQDARTRDVLVADCHQCRGLAVYLDNAGGGGAELY